MLNYNGVIEIGKNCIRYFDEALKISNISRTYIIKYQNKERKAFEDAKIAYEIEKERYEAEELRKVKEKSRNYTIATVALILLSLIFFSSRATSLGVVLLFVGGACGYLAYQEANKSVSYNVTPPKERPFPDKYGLCIEMNSSYSVTFTAIGSDGHQALRQLQNEINDADEQHETTIFNMIDNRITVENNDGIISTGDNVANTVKEREGSTV